MYSRCIAVASVAKVPKRSLDVSKCEISKFVVLSAAGITPVSFTVPRKGDQFQEDIFPDSNTNEAQLTSDQWFAGQSKPPAYATMKPGASAVKKETAKRLSPAEVQVTNTRPPAPAPAPAPPSRRNVTRLPRLQGLRSSRRRSRSCKPSSMPLALPIKKLAGPVL